MIRRTALQVAAPSAAIGFLLLLICLVSAWHINQLQASMGAILRENVSSLRAAQQLEVLLRQLRLHCFAYLVAPTGELRKQVDEIERQFEEGLEKARLSSQSETERVLVNEIRQAFERYRGRFDQLSSEVTSDRPRRDIQRVFAESPVSYVVAPCRSFLEKNEQMMEATAEESQQLSHRLQWVMLVVGFLGPFGGLLSGYGIARGLSRSIYQLSVRVQDVAQQLEHDVASVRIHPDGDLGRLDHQLQHIVRRVTEVVEQSQRQQQGLLRAEQLAAVGQLAATAAHEIRNPLSAIKMLVSIALRAHNPEALTQEDLRVIHDEVGRLERTVQSLLDLARPPRAQRIVCDLRPVLAAAVDLIRARAGQESVALQVRCPEEPVLAKVDSSQMTSVLVNLFMNALDAMPYGGQLGVCLECPRRDRVWLQVTDTGHGIPGDMMEHLFDPFASNKPTGTGLGLSIARRVVEEHGGQIFAANRGTDGKGGACFTITLPAEPREVVCAQVADHR